MPANQIPTSNTLRRSMGVAILAAIFAAPASAEPPAPAANPSPFPGPGEFSKNGFDSSDPLKVSGLVEMVDSSSSATIVWMVAKTVLQDGPLAHAGTAGPGAGKTWRVEGAGLAKIKPADLPKLVAGATIIVEGDNNNDKTCKPACRIKAEHVTIK
jgi:hypothetical protein